MTRSLHVAKVTSNSKGRHKVEHAIAIFVVFLFVFGTLAIVAWALFEMSPFAHHKDQFRDPRTGKRTGPSPRLD